MKQSQFLSDMRANANSPNNRKCLSQATNLLKHLENLQDMMVQDSRALGTAACSSKCRTGWRQGTSTSEGRSGQVLQGNYSTMLQGKLFYPAYERLHQIWSIFFLLTNGSKLTENARLQATWLRDYRKTLLVIPRKKRMELKMKDVTVKLPAFLDAFNCIRAIVCIDALQTEQTIQL